MDDESDQGQTALLLAAVKGRTEAVKFLLAHGADLGGSDINGTTPLMAAAVSGSLPTVQLLLDHQADPTVRNNDDLTAAAIATYLKKPAVAALLRKAGGGE